MVKDKKSKFSCNNTVCEITIEENRKEELKSKVAAKADKSPVIFIENPLGDGLVKITIIVASNKKTIKDELENLSREINSVRIFNSSNVKGMSDPVQFTFPKRREKNG